MTARSYSRPSFTFVSDTAIALVLVFTSSLACADNEKDLAATRSAPIRAVEISEVTRARLARPVHASGLVGTRRQTRLSFKIGGILNRLTVDEGDRVKRGQMLASLDRAEIDAQVTQARRAFEKAERDLARVRSLYEKRVATLEQLEDATTGFDVTRESLSIAEFNQRHARIIAPADGRVLKRFAEEGEVVGQGTPVLWMSSDHSGFVVRAGVAEREVAQLALGDPARIRVRAFDDQVFEGKITEIAALASIATGTFEVELSFDTQDPVTLRTGMSARVEIQPFPNTTFFSIPIEALVEGDGREGWVYALSPDGTHVRRVVIETAFIDGQRLAVIRGLEQVTNVVTSGAQYLADGEQVRIVQEVIHADR